MRKKELLLLSDWKPSAKTVELAEKDVPELRGLLYKKWVFKNDIHMEAFVSDNIMAVLFFETRGLRTGSKRPIYITYFKRNSDWFLTYDWIAEKWRTAVVNRLPELGCYKSVYASTETQEKIKGFLRIANGDYRGLNDYQDSVRANQLYARHKKTTDPWQDRMKQVPAFPKDWISWLNKTVITEHFIFYTYAKKVTEGYCTRCGKMVPIKRPRYNETGRCPHCRHIIKYKSIGKSGYHETKREYAYLIQPYGKDGGIVIREFCIYNIYKKGDDKKPCLIAKEDYRLIVDKNHNIEKYFYGIYKNDYPCWIKMDNRIVQYSWWYNPYPCYGKGKIYPKNLFAMKRQALTRSGLCEFLRFEQDVDPMLYFQRLEEQPIVERLIKAGLSTLASEVVNYGGKLDTVQGKTMAKELKIDVPRMERLRKNKGGVRYLEWLQYEKKADCILPEYLIQWMLDEKIRPDELAFILDRMSVVQIYNYLCKQQKKCGENVRQLLITWKDYLSMAEKIGKDVRDPIIYRTTDLEAAHEKAVILLEKRKRGLWMQEMQKKYPNIMEVYQKIRKKYEYLEDDEYAVVVPHNLEEIVEDGIALHHCVGSEERYYDRINRQESYILFLRRKEDLQKPYYTMEVEPGGSIRQIRAKYDKKDENIDRINVFVRDWQKEVLKRMKKEDFKLAKKSTELRREEYEQLRKDQVKIYRGLFAGQLLADILERDLLENVTTKAA